MRKLHGLQARIEQWIEFSTHDIDAPLQSWVLPVRGRMPYDKKVPLRPGLFTNPG